MIQDGLRPYFTLRSLTIKPMEAPPPMTTISVKGSSFAHNKTFEWQVDFPAGYHLPFLVKLQEYSRETWDKLHGVEIVADFGEQALDWEFCLDDLEIQFFMIPEPGRNLLSGQSILEDHQYQRV